MFSKHIVLLLINSYLCLSELSISPSRDIVINEGDPLKITCIASENVDFFFPKNITSLDVATSSVSVVRELANGMSKFTFKRSKTIFGDSGWYGCIETSKNQPKLDLGIIYVTPDTYDKKDVKWTYVFVKSTKHLLVNMPFLYQDTKGTYNLIEEEGNDVLLPCRPTSTDYEVKFYSLPDNKLINQSEYDPKRGMIVKNIKRDSLLNYYCLAVGNDGTNTERRNFRISMIVSKSETPVILSDRRTYMEVGKNFSMECVLHLWDCKSYFADWITPQTDRITKELISHRNFTFNDGISNYRLLSLKLTVKNVTMKDFGEYECRLYKYASVTAAKVKLMPHERRHLELSLRNPESVHVTEKDTPHTWTVDVDAYPLPELHWFDPQGNEVPDPKSFHGYRVNGEKFSVDLTKKQFTVEDLGTHTIFANTSDMNKAVTFNVTLNTLPKVIEVKQKQPWSEKEAAIMECQAKGFPVPDITWDCSDQNHELVGSGPEFFEVVETHPESTEVLSVVKVKTCKLGYVSCTAQNEYGEDIMTKKFTIQDRITPDGSANKDLQAVVGAKSTTNNVDNSDSRLPQTEIGAPPEIVKEKKKQIKYNIPDLATFQCRATGNPKPNITWEYLDDNKTIIPNGSDFIEVIKESSNTSEVSSFARTKIVMPGYVSCKAQNKYGMDVKLETIIFEDPLGVAQDFGNQASTTDVQSTNAQNLNNSDDKLPEKKVVDPVTESKNPVSEDDATKFKNLLGNDNASNTKPTKPTGKPNDIVPFGLSTWRQELKVTEGSTIDMSCGASMEKFHDDIQWYNSSHYLAADGRAVISETKAASSLLSRLTITNVQKWDEGDYTCEGTTKNGSTVKNHYYVNVNASAVFSASVVLQLSIILLSFFMS